MLIAITATGKELSSQVDDRFGRAKFIILYNSKDSTFQVHDNTLNSMAVQGAGVKAAQNIIDLEAEVLITGNCGPKALQILELGKVKIFSVSNLSVENAIKNYLEHN